MNRPLTIGIDARAAAEEPAGRGRLVRELLGELGHRDEPHRYRLYARSPWDVLDSRFSWTIVGDRDPLWHVSVARRASRECDVFLSSNSYLTAWFTTIPTVCVVYDLVAFDRSLHPRRRSAVIERLTLGVATRRAAAFVAISAATERALVDRFPRCAGRTTVALLGAAEVLVAAPDEAQPDDPLPAAGFVLAVGTLEPRKNLPRLVEAFGRLPAELQARHPLVIVGGRGWQTREILRSAADRATLLGYVSDQRLAELYRRCSLFCYPSLGEGFGLPVLEAMSAGAAVVTSNVSSLPEVGGDAVALADPRDVASITSAMRRVLEDHDYAAGLRQRAIARAALFSWATFAERTLAVLELAGTRGGA